MTITELLAKFTYLGERLQIDNKELTILVNTIEPSDEHPMTVSPQRNGNCPAVFIRPDVLRFVKQDENDFFRVQVN